MASVDITSVIIEAKSQGVDAATKSLNNLSDAADKAEKATGKLGTTSKASDDSVKASSSAIDKLLVKYQAQVDLLGATTAASNAYTAALKGGSDAQQSAAAFLGAEVDAYKALASAQAEGIAMNKALDKSYDSLSKQADAYYASQAKIAAAAQALNDAGYRAQEYAKLQDAMKALEQETNALAAAEAREKAIQQNRDIEMHTQQVRAYSAAQSEAIRINNDLAVAEQRQAKASQEAFNAIGPTRANLDQANQASEKWVKSLQDQAARAGLAGKALRDYNADLLRTQAAQLGVSEQAEPLIQTLQKTEKASAHAGGGLSGITRELIVLGHEASQGQFSRFGGSMIVLGERMDIGGKIARYFAAGIEAAGGSVVAFLAPIAAAVAVVGTLATAFMTWLHSVQAVHEFNKELILTGGYAGKSANELYTMADSIGKVYGNVGAAREAMTKLVATGKFSSDQINDITKAAVGLYTYGGVAIDKTIAQFEKLAKEPLTNTERAYSQVSKAAMELDQSMHFLEPTVMKAIIDQEKLGNLHEASAIATKALADEETKRAKELEENMTTLGKLAHTVGAAFTNMWNSLWTKKSPQQELSGLVEQLKALPSAAEAAKGIYGGASVAEQKGKILKQMAVLQNQIYVEVEKARQKSVQDDINADANRALNYDRMIDDKMKGLTRFQQEEAKINASDDAKRAAGMVVSQEDHDKRIAWAHKEYDEHHKVKALGFADINLEISSIKSAQQAQLDAADLELKSIKALADARKINVFQQQKETDDALQLKLTALKEGEKAELTAIANDIARKGRSATEIKELQNRYVQAYTTSEKAINGVNEALQKNDNLVSELAGKAADAQAQANAKVIDSIKASVNAVQAKIDAYNRLPESVKKAGVTEKQIQDQITQSYIDNLQAELDQTIANNNVEEPIAKARIEFLKQQIQLKQQLKSVQVAEETIQATNKAIQDYNTAWKQANKQIGDDLASAIIDGGGKGWKKLIKDMEMAFAKMILRPILEPISGAFASLTTTVGASNPGAVDGSGAVGLAATASKTYSALTGGIAAGLGTAATGIGNLIGSSAVSAFGAGLSGGSGVANAITAYTAAGQTATASALSLGSTVAAAIPWIAGAAGILGVLKFGFGMGSKTTTSQGISGTISDSGVTGQSYQNWMQKGGWFRSDKHGQDTQALTTDVVNSFMSGLTSMKSSATDFAKNLNVSADSLKNYSKTFDITLTSDAAANQKAIAEFFTIMGDDMATKLVPNIAEFAKQGETASVTLQRLSDTFKTTNAVMDLFGINSEKVFGGLGLESAKARQYLVDLAGGISNLGSQATFYAQNFLSSQEQIAPVQKAVANALAELGHSEVKTIEGFKALVNSLNLVDPAQAQLFESLMQLAPAFKQVTDAMDAATKAAQDQAVAEKAKADQAKLDMISGLKSVAQNDFDVLSKAITAAKNNAQAAYDAQAAILNAQISSLATVSQNIGALSTALDSALHTMTDNTVLAMTRAEAQAQLDVALNEAKRSGQLPSADSLKNTLSVLGKDPAASFSSYQEYMKDQAITANKVSALNDIAKNQKTAVDKQLDVAKDQLVQLKNNLDAEMAMYDQMLSVAQQQLDAMNGTTVAIKDLMSALTSFAASANLATKAQAGMTGSNGQPIAAPSATANDIVNLYQTLLNRAPEAQGLTNALEWASKGGTALDIAANIMKSPEYARIHGSHATGLDDVPFDGYTAKLHKGEMVLPAKQAKGVIQGEDMKAVVDAINNLCADNSAENRSLVSDIKWLRKLFQNMAPSNDRLQVHDIGAA